MNEQECLTRMVPPSKVRPGKMGGHGGVIQILLTRACSKACYGCSQGSQLAGKPEFMPVELFEQAVLSLKGYFGLTALFGGQPTLHPQFPEICAVLSKHVPINKRGLWTNALNGHGVICRKTFLPQNCNLNVHLDKDDYEEFRRDWPEARPFGLTEDSRHSPCYVAMKDVLSDEEERWRLISKCPINQNWSAGISTFRGELRGYFCEIAMAQSGLHQHEPDYPDTGLKLWLSDLNAGWVPWWQAHMGEFREQVRKHCHECSVPLQGYGELSQSDNPDSREQVSITHQSVYTTKRKGRRVELVVVPEQLGKPLENMTRYLQNSHL